MLNAIGEINQAETSILLVEQTATAALQIAHRAYVLQHGSIVLRGEAASMIDNPVVNAAYLADT